MMLSCRPYFIGFRRLAAVLSSLVVASLSGLAWADGQPPACDPSVGVEGAGNGVLSSTLLAGGGGGGRIQVLLNRPGLELEDDGLRACLTTDKGGLAALGIVALTEVSGSQGGYELTLEIPASAGSAGLLPWYRQRLIVAAPDGRFAAATDVTLARFWSSFALAWLPILGIFYWMSSRARDRFKEKTGQERSKLASLFIGRTGKASVAQFQMWLWTFLIAASIVFVFLQTGELFAVTPTALVLLGFAGGGSLGARSVAMTRQERAYQQFGADGAPSFASKVRFSDLFTTSGRVDLFKFQILAFTLIIAAYVVLQVVATSAFPEIPESMLLLMGISNGVYVVSKTGGTTAFGTAEAKSVELEVRKTALADIEQKLPALTDEVASLNEQKTELEQKIAPLDAESKERADKQKQLDALEKRLAPKDQDKKALEAKKAKLQTEIDTLKSELNEILKQVTGGST